MDSATTLRSAQNDEGTKLVLLLVIVLGSAQNDEDTKLVLLLVIALGSAQNDGLQFVILRKAQPPSQNPPEPLGSRYVNK